MNEDNLSEQKANRRCADCELKYSTCSLWKNKEEKSVTGWDKNRAAVSCLKYKVFGGDYVR